jgi:hypothetical protein
MDNSNNSNQPKWWQKTRQSISISEKDQLAKLMECLSQIEMPKEEVAAVASMVARIAHKKQ